MRVSALLLCAPARVRRLVVEGRIVVEGGELRTLSLEPVSRAAPPAGGEDGRG